MKLKNLFLTAVLATASTTTMAQSGTCGDNLAWVLENGTLTISGTGAMTEFYNRAPWYDYRSQITTARIEDGVTTIGDLAFWGCTGLTSVILPNSITTIGPAAFYGCRGLTSVIIPNSVTVINYRAFENCTGLTSVTIPNSVTVIDTGTFYGCTGLTSVSIPNSITTIGSSAFYGCAGLTSITIPNSVTEINYRAFYDTGWYNNQPDGVLYLDDWLICHKGNMLANTNISILPSTKAIAGSAFFNCEDLTSVTIPNGVTDIGSRAFENCMGLTSVTIPNSVTAIGDRAFWGCTGLTSVTIGNDVTQIGDEAFGGCTGLTSVTIPNGVTAIGSAAFGGCTGLTSVILPNSVTRIGYYAFYGCTGLMEIHNKSTAPQTTASDAFYNVNLQTCTLYVPECAVPAYRSALVWQDFDNIVGEDKCETDIRELSANGITVFPNPAAESFRIGGIGEATTVIVRDIAGKTMLRQTVNPGEAVSVSRLPEGLYVVFAGGKAIKLKVKN